MSILADWEIRELCQVHEEPYNPTPEERKAWEALPPPMISRYQTHASGLMGSPTEPSTRRLDRSYASGISRPAFMNDRMAVGAV